MIVYHILLYVHLLALIAAAAASGIMHLAEAGSRRAGSLAELRPWLLTAKSTARVFPFATLTLFATGGAMVSMRGPWSWTDGWVLAGVAGVAWLMGSGAVLGARGARIGKTLASLRTPDMSAVRAALRDPVKDTLSWINTGVAMGVVFAMAAKPALAGALLALLAGAAAGLVTYGLTERKRAGASAPVAAPRAQQGAAA